MAKATVKVTAPKNGHTAKPKVSKLGIELRKIRAKIEASGDKLLTMEEFEQEMIDRRTGNY